MENFTFILDSYGANPLYMQVYQHIVQNIRCGLLMPGEKLPSKRRLAAHLAISQNTVETAYGQLMAEGYIKSWPKKGYYICDLEGKALLFGLDKKPKADILEDVSAQAGEEKPAYRFDFKTSGIDTALFPFPTWKKVSKEVLQDKNRHLLEPGDPQGEFVLREAIADYLRCFRGVNCGPEQIIIGAGTEYLTALLIQILGRGTVFAMENPGYPKTYQVLAGNDIKLRLIPLDQEGISLDKLKEAAAEAVYITPSHQFPTGLTMPVSRRLQLLGWAAEQEGRWIIEDDYDSEFRFDGRPIPALQGLDSWGKVIYLSTFSRSIAPSMRISYMVLPPGLLQIYRRDFRFYSATVSRFEQFSLYKFMEGGHFERHLNKMRNIYRARKDALVEEICKLAPGKVEIIGANAGLHLLLRVFNGMGEEELLRRAANEGIKLYGLSGYFFRQEESLPNNTLVLGYAAFDLPDLQEAARLLCRAWFPKRR